MTRDETTNEEKSSRSYWGFVLWPLAVVVLYVLSAGPVLLAVQKGITDFRTLRVYKPLATTIEATPLKTPFGMYLNLWCPGFYRGGTDLFFIF